MIKAMRKAISASVYAVYIILIIMSLGNIRGSDVLSVEADGEKYAFSLSEDGIYSVEGAIGTTVIEIRDSKARIIESPCPGKTCIAAGWSDILCCLPNKVICTAEASEGETDAISG